ncbi:MAG: arsenate reductase ArsC [Myxococcota bacterium]
MTKDELTSPHRNGLLFVCIGNNARSQMAEAFARFIGPADFVYYSAGVQPADELTAHSIKAMREVGVDISAYRPKALSAIPMGQVATVITLCEGVTLPALPEGVQHLPYPLPDPNTDLERDEDPLQAYRRVRDQIRELVSRLF